MYSPDRLLTPLVRNGPKGSGRFKRASWDEALEVVAERVGTVVKTLGGEAVLPWWDAGTQGLIQMSSLDRRLFAKLGASRLTGSLCGGTASDGTAATYGTAHAADPMDVRHAKFVLLWGTNTKLTKRTGWAPKGERYNTHAPFGSWQTQTFIAALRCHELTAPWIINAPMNKQLFEVYVETQLAPTLQPGDVVILDNVAFHKSQRAEDLINARGAWLLFLPPYSPDLNPIELAYSKLKALLRKHAARTFDAICDALGEICDLYTSKECMNFFKEAGYETD